jgi:Uma2 family endonuclease
MREWWAYTVAMNLDISAIELPVRLRFERPMSDEELLRFSAKNDLLRIEREPNGEILVMTPAGFKTSRMNQRIGRFLDEWTEADGRGVATDSNGGYTLPDGSVRAPDAAWVSLARLKTVSAEEQDRFVAVCPEFVIELVSPSDRLPGVEAKMEQWIANGAEVGWLIDPERRVVAIYRAGQVAEVLEDPSSVQGNGPVAGFELVMERVWGSLPL